MRFSHFVCFLIRFLFIGNFIFFILFIVVSLKIWTVLLLYCKKLRKGRNFCDFRGDTISVGSSKVENRIQHPKSHIKPTQKQAQKSDYERYAAMCGVDVKRKTEKISSLPKLEEAINYSPTRIHQPQGSQRHLIKNKDLPYKLENHFIDVGSLTYGSIFGLGEQIEHRVIMARTTVQCLLIPRFWLLEKQQNPGNIWQGVRFYLDSTIPSREILFQDFLATHKWQKFKKDIITKTLNNARVGNPTKLQDIPIVCQILEAFDDCENTSF